MCCFGTNLYVSMYVIIIIKCLVHIRQVGILVFFCFKTFKGEISLVFVCIVRMYGNNLPDIIYTLLLAIIITNERRYL